MRELDTEAPVVWPAWCYQSGEITLDSSPQTASSPSLQISPTASTNGSLSNSSEIHKSLTAASRTTKRKSAAIHNSLQYSVDKMLNERNKLIAEDNKSFLQHTSSTLKNNNNTSFNNNNNNNNSFNGSLVSNNHHHNHHSSSSAVAVAMKDLFNPDKHKYHPDSNMNVIKNGQLSPSTAQKLSQITLSKCLSNGTNNGSKANGTGSTVKTERLSPPVVNDLSMYRSRSVTPQSTGTPPQTIQPNNLMNNPNISSINSLLSAASHLTNNGNGSNNSQQNELPVPQLNYSEMMRSLAAKYNNSNDLPTPKASVPSSSAFIDARSSKPIREPSTSNSEKQPNSPPQIPANPNLLSSLFSSLQFNQNSIFNPMLDMGSTRALVLLARAAKEAEMQNLLKDSTTSSPEKSMKMPSLSNFPSTSTQLPNFNGFNPFPALTNLQALHQLSTRSPPAPPLVAAAVAAQIPYKSPTTTSNIATVSDSQSGTSPLDLSSSSTPPLAKRMKLSPTSTETTTQRQQQATSPTNVTTTNNQLTTSSTVGFSASSSSSTTSNGSEQASGNAQSARKCQLKIDEINAWNVDEVCSFVEGIAICAEYVKNFRDQSIDGEGLIMLTEEHLINILGMKLGPALKLRSNLLKRLNEPCEGKCAGCIGLIASNSDENLNESKSFLNNFTKMSIPRSNSADSGKF